MSIKEQSHRNFSRVKSSLHWKCTKKNRFHKIIYILLAVSRLGRIAGPVSTFITRYFLALCAIFIELHNSPSGIVRLQHRRVESGPQWLYPIPSPSRHLRSRRAIGLFPYSKWLWHQQVNFFHGWRSFLSLGRFQWTIKSLHTDLNDIGFQSPAARPWRGRWRRSLGWNDSSSLGLWFWFG